MGYSLFQPSTLGMKSQAHALNTLGTNIANINTSGYKKTDTRFATVLGGTILTGAGQDAGVSFADRDFALGGVKPVDYQRISGQGTLTATERDLDLAIAGTGFFQVSPTIDVSGDILFTRDGGFNINIAGPTVQVVADDGNTIDVNQGYLADKNGFFLLGFEPNADGTFPTTGTLTPMRVDPYAFASQFTETLNASLQINLPANDQLGDDQRTFPLEVVDSNGNSRIVTLNFAKTETDNEWQVTVTGDNLTTASLAAGSAFSLSTGPGTGRVLNINPASREITARAENLNTVASPGAFLGLKAGDSITLAGTAGNNGTFTIASISSDFSTITVDAGTPLPGAPELLLTAATASSTTVVADRLVFDGEGQLVSPANYTVSATWDDASTSNFTLDLSTSTQFNGQFTFFNADQDGQPEARLRRVSFDTAGHVVGEFEDGSSRLIYKVPLATFSNPDGLEQRNGNVFAETPFSGAANTVLADVSGVAQLSPNSLELSNALLPQEFTRMIQVQQAYNSSATVFKTVDEMTVVARDLKA